MATRLRDEIKQSKPFQSLEQEALLSIERTAAVLGHAVADALKPYGVTPTQYNVLRILRGAGRAGLCRNEVRERMIAQVPDVTRLLDRLAEMGLIDRERDSGDRRLVTTRITPQGLRLLRQLDLPISEIHERQLGHMSGQRLHTLIELLSVAREKA
ncbi:MAG: MarR family winged helix-turn-helix transcriptional regulator [Gemmatimonadaceae bacterium]